MKIRFIYFDTPFWRAEVSRLALYIGKIDFDDVRVKRDEFLQARRTGKLNDGTTVPFRQLPILVIDQQTISQTAGIARLCGKLGGLYPLDQSVKAAQIDQVIDMATDITSLLTPSMRENNSALKKAMRKDLSKASLPRLIGFLEELLVSQQSTWFVGDTMTIADLAIWRLMGSLTSEVTEHIPNDILSSFPRVQKICWAVGENPRVIEWIQKTYPKNYSIGNPT